jgi:hypothetical protein
MVLVSGLAPFASNKLSASRCPFRRASQSGVIPNFKVALTSAPGLIKNRISFRFPEDAAPCSAPPVPWGVAFGLVPSKTRQYAIVLFPDHAACESMRPRRSADAHQTDSAMTASKIRVPPQIFHFRVMIGFIVFLLTERQRSGSARSDVSCDAWSGVLVSSANCF